MNVEKYLMRIQCEDATTVSLENLRKLHSNHLLSIPFENFSIALNERVTMNMEAMYDKVINKKRGGFCFELNSLFAWLLKELGYTIKLISCRTYPLSLQIYYPWFTHMSIITTLNGNTYLTDVGFSTSFRYPLEFVPGKVQMGLIGHYKIEKTDVFDDNGKLLDNIYTLYKTVDDLNDPNAKWNIMFGINSEPRQVSEFEDMLEWVQTKDCARLYNRSFCMKHAKNSYHLMLVCHTLTKFEFKNGVEISRKDTEISPEKLHETIENEFNIKISRDFKPRNIQL